MTFPKKLIKEIKTIKDLIQQGDVLLNLTIQNLDLRNENIDWEKLKIGNTTFLGCDFSYEVELLLRKKGAIIYPKIVGLPYNPYRKTLYSWRELLSGYSENEDASLDFKIYNHFLSYKNMDDINEALCQRIHDHSIDDALRTLIGFDENGMTKKKCIGVMGGHSVLRTDPFYEKVAFLAKKLAKNGYLVLSGGGPGIMEAANLGAYLANIEDSELQNVLNILKEAPSYKDTNFVEKSQKIISMYPEGVENYAIPTWFYGHEPSNLFATQIAKYFSNAIREDILLEVALHGIVYAPGSAGTIQEVFTDAAQNYYSSFGWVSPMIFLGRKFWSEDSFIYQLLRQLSTGYKYHEMMGIFDDPEEIVRFIEEHPPVKGA